MLDIIIATKNRGKANEFSDMLEPYGFRVKTLLDIPNSIDVDETGSTFEENAILKAEAISMQYNIITIADDSGLVVDALDGRPGVYSARYAGEAKNDQENMDKVLIEMETIPDSQRTARFYCALAVAVPGKKTITVSGTCEGKILRQPQGTNGFGYDPIFWVPAKEQTLAQLQADEKNKISHRGMALKKLSAILNELFG
ncbi:XTP/dITP diphosphatase [Heyndrickxia acidicola]|uniref:dITP/XTP pyrophosphatase n=1 Tax=Heyndrickxia acidicola TaxID=209389 RepID=A0ABU6MJI4_9BACI|nr:XTP/dITP diphosphatase [Heyndrickxia acidicola]MED1204835.1 XTP/dITP diphosphatase [Heyndrickxia acidicola]